MRLRPPVWLALVAVCSAGLLAPVAPVGVAGATPSVGSYAKVAVSDSGFTPLSVTIGTGGVVEWVNQGNQVHTATADPGAGVNFFDTGGISPAGGSSGIGFQFPGAYTYHSETDTGQLFRGMVIVTPGPPACQ